VNTRAILLSALMLTSCTCSRGTGPPTYAGIITNFQKGSSGGLGASETVYITLANGCVLRVDVSGARRIPGVGDYFEYWVDWWNGDWWATRRPVSK
jgi:hypothetical protein